MNEIADLTTAARSGDLEAFGDLVVRFQSMAISYACGILGDQHEAEDAVQDAFIEVYDRLPALDNPLAFPGWLRRLVFKHCDRRTRRKSLRAVPLDGGPELIASELDPSQFAENRELTRQVLGEIQTLPPEQRDVVTLFYLREYSQAEISQFLEVPVKAVKSRLQLARQNLKGRFMNVLEKSVKNRKPHDLFARHVIDRLVSRPKPLDMRDHPIRMVWDEVRKALCDYEVIEGSEIEDAEVARSIGTDSYPKAYHVAEGQVLRTQTTGTLWQALPGRHPPIKILTAGRVFRQDRQDARRTKVFHQTDAVCVDTGADAEQLRTVVDALLKEVLAIQELRWRPADLDIVDTPFTVSVKSDHGWTDLGGAGLLKRDVLQTSGFDPDSIIGFAFGLGIERLAMVKFGIEDVRDLWRPPYVS